MASPLLANNAKEAGTENAPARVITVTAEKPEAAAKPEPSPIESEVRDLRGLVEEQRAELESQRAALKAAEAKMEALEEKLSPASPRPVAVAASSAIPAAFSTPVVAATPATVAASAASPAQKDEPASPLQFRIGSAYITPVGFMDFTSVWRNHDAGSGIGTNFAGIPYGNTFNNHLSELRLSMQNSRIGFRVDALVKGARVMGYMESDFLGNNPGNVSVTSNSNTLRSRLVGCRGTARGPH